MHNLHFQYVKAAGSLPSYTHKGPEEIVENYLTKVFDCVIEAVDLPEELRARIPVDIVVTIPAVCHCIALYIQSLNFMPRIGPTGLKTLLFEHLLESGSTETLSQRWHRCC